jgi:predicted O-methyltransferase YrrM
MFGYDLQRLPNAHLADLERGVTTTDEAAPRSGATIGYPGWGLIYHVLLCHLDRSRPEIIVETGTNFGCTTIVLAQALIDAGCAGEVLTFELESANVARAKANAEKAGVASRIRFHEGNSIEQLPAALAGLSDIRFVFLDASHLLNDVLREFEALQPHLADDALVLFDNTYRIASDNEDQRVNGALREITHRFGGNLVNFEFVSWFTPGLAIWQNKPKL